MRQGSSTLQAALNGNRDHAAFPARRMNSGPTHAWQWRPAFDRCTCTLTTNAASRRWRRRQWLLRCRQSAAPGPENP